ncbi:MAG: MCE family protein [Pseudonocardiaceae bacterium]|nr:MCE family protein [Pseudonocardiaceae bacterium]
MNTVRSGRLWAAAVLAVVAMTAAGTIAATVDREDDRMTVTAMFTDASPMVPGNEVRAAGVTVGQIQSIELNDGRAQVEMSVDKSVLPMHQDARAVITPKDLLGERFINLERGSLSAPLLDESRVIPASQTDRAVSLQEVLNAVDDPTGTALAALVTTLGEGTRGLGPEIAAGIEATEPALRQADELARILGEQNELLTQLVDSAQPVANALAADRGENLDRLVGSTEQTLSTVAANSKAVQGALERLPQTLASAQRTLARTAGVAEQTTPTLAAMRPVTDDLTDISGELRRFADATDPALASLDPVLERANVMLDEAAPLVRALQPAGPDFVGVAESGRTLMEQAVSKRLPNLMEFVKGWALSTSGYDGLSHYFRAIVPTTPKSLGVAGMGPAPGAPESPVPSLPLPHAPLPPPLGPVDEGPEYPLEPAPEGSATGLTEEQEKSMLSQLLGGR